MSVGERITELRKAQNISQAQLADQLAVSRQAVSKWENDLSVPDASKMIALADALDTDIEYLSTGRRNFARRPPVVLTTVETVEKVVEKPVIQVVEKIVEVEKPVIQVVEKIVEKVVTKEVGVQTVYVVAFDYGKAELDQTGRDVLNAIPTDVVVDVQGEASYPGSKEFNQKLSERRATVVSDYLTNRGVKVANCNGVGATGHQIVKVVVK